MTQDSNYSHSYGNYKRFGFKAALELAAPPTWAAAIMSVVVGGAAAVALTPQATLEFDLRTVGAWILMLITAVVMQSAVNTLNDYKDFLSGTDTADTILDENDASIVYNEINPKAALHFAIALLVVAAITGLVIVFISGWPLLVLGIIAAAAVVLYSVGPKPISFLPIGEAISGIVMGGFITIATFYAMTMDFLPQVILLAIPPIITVALIMLTNNTCDIERDTLAGRKTLPILLGRKASMKLAQMLSWGTLAFMVVWIVVHDMIQWRSMVVLAISAAFALILYFMFRQRIARIASGSYSVRNRKAMMGNIVMFCYLINAMWSVMLLASWGLGEILSAI
jgi:1,4-dihydroxy-2-naphthoate octaprenyltransferase